MFILITPAHNEAKQVEGLVRCMRSSKLKPDLWLIVDDNSDDGTKEKFLEIGKDLDFLEVHRISGSREYMEFHISEVLQSGFKKCINFLKRAKIIGILDSDIRFGPTYWSKLSDFLYNHPKYGIVSGVLSSPKSSGSLFVEPYQRTDNPRGGLRLINGTCFRQIGGVERSRAWDPIMNVRCRLLDWKLATLQDVYAESVRPTSERYTKKSGAVSFGRRAWHLHQPFWQIIVRSLALIFKGNFRKGFYYYKGFLWGWWKREEQFPDRSIRNYYRYERSYEWLKMLRARFFGKKNNSQLIPVKEISKKDIYQ